MNVLPNFSASRAESLISRRACANGAEPAGGGVRPARFRRTSRLLRHADFQRVYQQGRRHFAAHMTVFYRPRADAAGPRVGFTVGRVLGGAVDRNRIRRRLREAVRANLVAFAASADVVINPKKSALTADFALLRDEVATAFRGIQEKLK